MAENISRSWDRLPDEDEKWYHIFVDYYLPLGNKRSVRNAFEFFIRVEEPANYQNVDPNDIRYTPDHWGEEAEKHEWAKRALEYDESVATDFSQLYVTTVLNYLQANALGAAKSLVEALKNERTRVQAANSILNRAGVPEVSEVNFKAGVAFTADDMAAAQEELTKWTQSKNG